MPHQFVFPADTYILIGTVAKAQGMRGEVTINAFSGQPENFQSYRTLVLVDRQGELSPELSVEGFRLHGGRPVVRFDRVTDRTFAEKLVGMGVLLRRQDLPPAAGDEYYWCQIVGLPVNTVAGEALGVVVSLFSSGAQDVMEIADDQRRYLVPVTPSIVVSLDNDRVVIDPPPGLLEINDDEVGTPGA